MRNRTLLITKKTPPRPHESPDLPDSTIDGTVNTESSPATTLDSAMKSKESELRDLLDLPTPNSVHRDVNTESPPASDLTEAAIPSSESQILPDPPDTNERGPQDKPQLETIHTQESTDMDNQQNQEIMSINTELDTPITNDGARDNASSINSHTNNEDMRDLHDAGLSPSREKPMEKVYNEWITTFSDDSLFDEMTEGSHLNREQLKACYYSEIKQTMSRTKH